MKMPNDQNKPVNDIAACVETARIVAVGLEHSGQMESKIFAAFQSLAGDIQTGFLAYVIWRSRFQA
jgi:hypothetical protein